MFRFKKNFSIRESLDSKINSSPIKSQTVDLDTAKPLSFGLGPTIPLSLGPEPTKPLSLGLDLNKSLSIALEQTKSLSNGSEPAKSSTIVIEPAKSKTVESESELIEPGSPVKKRVKLDSATIKTQKEARLRELKSQTEEKLRQIKQMRRDIHAMRTRRSSLLISIAVAQKGQNDVRNQLNQIYNPGTEQATAASQLIEDKRSCHSKKMESFKIEMSKIIDGCKSAIERRRKQLDHEIELHQRTVMTLESPSPKVLKQQNGQLDDIHETPVEDDSLNKSADLSVEKENKLLESSNSDLDANMTDEVFIHENDDDCVILDGKKGTQQDSLEDEEEQDTDIEEE